MLIIYTLGGFRKFKELIFITFLALLSALIVKYFTSEYSLILLFNYTVTLLFLLLNFFSNKFNKEDDFNEYPLTYLSNYIIYCFFLLWFVVTLFQSYISMSIFDYNRIEFISFIFLFGIQARMLFFKQKKSQIILNSIDLFFLTTLLFFRANNNFLTIVIYIYSFRLFRILTLVPYFDKILSSIWRGFKISFHFIIAFFLIIALLSINSRILFNQKVYAKDFSSILTAFYNNFKISLGNGFDISASYTENNFIIFYIISLTFIMGVLFTSIFTALITDGLIKDDQLDDEMAKIDNLKNKWYIKQADETYLIFLFRINARIASI